MRGVLAVVLAVVGILLVPLADVGVWTWRELLPRDHFVALSNKVLDEDEVRVALAQRIAQEIDARADLSRRGRRIVEPAVEHGLNTQPARVIFDRAVGDVHDQLERGDDRLVLRFDALLPLVSNAVARADPDVAADLPDHLPEITIITQDDVPTFFRAVKLVRRASLVFPIVCVALLAAAIVLSNRRALALAVFGAAIAVISLVLLGFVLFGRDLLSSITGPALNVQAFEAGYDVVTHSFVIQTLGFAALGAAAVVAGFALKARNVRNTRPLGWA
jgi:hypothetical protein